MVEWLDARNIELRETAAPRDVLTHAVAVAEKHGIGKRSLRNFDCHYAYAMAAGDPLLTFDQRLRETDAATLP